MTTAALLGTALVKIILAAIALWLYWKFIVFASRKTAEAGERQRQLADLELLYVASCKWIAERDAKKARTVEQEAGPFMLDEHDLVFQLRRSIEIAQERNRNDAA